MTDVRIKKFGAMVRKLRKQKGLSQEEFASLSGIDRSYMGHIERGERNITLTKAFQVSDALQVNLQDLLD